MKSLLSVCSSMSSGQGDRSLSPRTIWSNGWRCDQWHVLDDLFGPVEELADATEVRRCSFCGLVFLHPPQLAVREHHLRVTHKLAACSNKADLFLDSGLFHEHLKSAHLATLGGWTTNLFRVCSVTNTSHHIDEDRGSFVACETGSQHADDISEGAVELWEDDEPQSTGEALVSGLWDSNLLGQWSTGRDRINRWMLHMLGAEAKNADVLRTVYQENHKGIPDVPAKSWSRLVLKYWFIDEAATGVDHEGAMPKSILGDLVINCDSLHLSARPSGTKSASAPPKSSLRKVAQRLLASRKSRSVSGAIDEAKRPSLTGGLPPRRSISLPLRWSSKPEGETLDEIRPAVVDDGYEVSGLTSQASFGRSSRANWRRLSQISFGPSSQASFGRRSQASSFGSIAERLHSSVNERMGDPIGGDATITTLGLDSESDWSFSQRSPEEEEEHRFFCMKFPSYQLSFTKREDLASHTRYVGDSHLWLSLG